MTPVLNGVSTHLELDEEWLEADVVIVPRLLHAPPHLVTGHAGMRTTKGPVFRTTSVKIPFKMRISSRFLSTALLLQRLSA
jgi:hypothetical protein